MHNIWRGKRGTTLIEILVVMVVLLIGIMTLIQMFPTGFRVVKAGESQTIATRLAQQELERWKTMSANLPDSIVPVNEAGEPLDGETPLSPFSGWYKYTVDGKDAYARGNALNFRQINGEFTLMPALCVFAGKATSRYTLAFGPIDAASVEVKGRDLMRTGTYSPLRPGQYKIDYTIRNGQAFQIYVPGDRAARRFYYVSYSVWAAQGTGEPQLFHFSDQQVPIVGNANGEWAGGWHDVVVDPDDNLLPDGYVATRVEQDSDSVARGFYRVTGFTGAPYTDFYEYKLADPIAGIIEFNNYAQGEFDYTPLGLQPLAARINYRIYDPRIIREDRVMPNPTLPALESKDPDISVKMSLRFILNLGDPEDDVRNINNASDTEEVVYKGIMRKGADASLPYFEQPLYVVDLATGWQVLLPGNYLKDTNDIANDGQLDFKTGTVKIPKTATLRDSGTGTQEPGVDMRGRKLRFFYRAEGDWTVQCHKACTSYIRAQSDKNIKYNRYFLRTGTNRLIFAKSQLEQTVMVDYAYSDSATGSEHRKPSRAYQIQQDLVTGETFVDLDLPAKADAMDPDKVIKRISVVGVSFKARVLWRDGTAWRKVDLDTTLTPTR